MKTSLFSTSPPTTPQGAHISLKTFLAAGAFSFAAVSFYKIQFEEKVTSMSKTVKTTGKALVGGDWTMVDITTGELVTNETVLEDGHFSLLYFGFAKCPDICPSELVKVGKVLDTMKKKHKHIKITPVFVTVDPARDSIKQLKLYGKDFHPDIKFVTGTPEMVKKMTKKYRVYVSKADEEDDGDYLVDHSIVLYFGGKKGEFLDFFSQSMKPSDICNKIVEQTEKY
ncbi:hypothetical protein ScalyP_jg3228 [Parmales sp. scaly parma]|nr:hypothetical protein ScalyP_jg3228 [Parmales sp. scaly parma]